MSQEIKQEIKHITIGDFDLVYNDCDGFINVSHLWYLASKLTGKQRTINNCTVTKLWKNFLEKFKKENPTITEPIYEIRDNVHTVYNGIYMHKNLIEYVATWCSIEFAIKYVKFIANIDNAETVDKLGYKECKTISQQTKPTITIDSKFAEHLNIPKSGINPIATTNAYTSTNTLKDNEEVTEKLTSDQTMTEMDNKQLYFKKDDDLFYEGHYNDVKIVYREKDKYINVTLLCANYSKTKPFYKFTQLSKWREIQENAHYLIGATKKEGQRDTEKTNDIPILYEIREGIECNKINGSYMHPDFVHFVAEWCSVEYSFKVAKVMNTINKELHERNITLEQKIQEMNSGRKIIEGEIEIVPKPNNIFHLYSRPFAFISPDENNIHFKVYNSLVVFDLFKYYSMFNVFKEISYEGKHEWCTDNVNNILTRLTEIKQNTLDLKLTLKETCTELFEKNKKCINSKVREGSLFEIWCALQFEMSPFKLSGAEKLGLNHKDIGVDLLDVENKISGQCKLYRTVLEPINIKTYITFVEWINNEDPTWKHKLFVIKSTKILNATKELCNKNKIEIVITDYDNEDVKNKFLSEFKQETKDDDITNKVKQYLDEHSDEINKRNQLQEYNKLTVAELRREYIEDTRQNIKESEFKNILLKFGTFTLRYKNKIRTFSYSLDNANSEEYNPYFEFIRENEQLFYIAEYIKNLEITDVDIIINKFQDWCKQKNYKIEISKKFFRSSIKEYLKVVHKESSKRKYNIYVLTDYYKNKYIKQYEHSALHTFLLEFKTEIQNYTYENLLQKYKKWILEKFGYETHQILLSDELLIKSKKFGESQLYSVKLD